jgi:hypothetical protein
LIQKKTIAVRHCGKTLIELFEERFSGMESQWVMSPRGTYYL